MKWFAAFLVCVAAAPAAAEIGRWQVDYGASRLGFTAEQAGAEFQGQFKSFDADVRFDPNALAQSSAVVSIETGSVDTANDERDGILRGEGWFESGAFPQAKFTVRGFTKADKGFVAQGDLQIRGASAPVTFQFSVSEAGGRVELTGSATLDRFAFGLGLGDWADTEWVGKDVTVNVTLVGTR